MVDAFSDQNLRWIREEERKKLRHESKNIKKTWTGAMPEHRSIQEILRLFDPRMKISREVYSDLLSFSLVDVFNELFSTNQNPTFNASYQFLLLVK
jgi:hypothetical protein